MIAALDRFIERYPDNYELLKVSLVIVVVDLVGLLNKDKRIDIF